MLRVVIPLVLVLLTAPVPELLYVQDGWVTGLRSGQLYEGTSPTRCSDGSIVYVREGDLWRDGERLFTSPEEEYSPSCVVDVLYSSGGYVWRWSKGSRTQLFEGTDPALSPDGRIAYVDQFQGIRGVYVRDGDTVFMPYKTYSSGAPSWGDGVLYIGGGGNWGWWDGTMHWSDYLGDSPCWTPGGVYYVWAEEWPDVDYLSQWDVWKDGKVVIEHAIQPAW